MNIWYVCVECGVPFEAEDITENQYMECNCGEKCIKVDPEKFAGIIAMMEDEV